MDNARQAAGKAVVKPFVGRRKKSPPSNPEGIKVYEYRFPDGAAFVQMTSARDMARAIQKDSCLSGGNKIVAERRQIYGDDEIEIRIWRTFDPTPEGRKKLLSGGESTSRN